MEKFYKGDDEMKKAVIPLLCALGITAAAFAASEVIEVQKVATDAEAFVSDELCAEKIDAGFSQIERVQQPENLDCIMNCSDEAKLSNIYAYIRFMCENDFSDEQLADINEILESGTTVQSLSQVYDFWLTTDEDFSVVAKICALENKYFNEYWYEDAFNEITNDGHGVLNRAQLKTYMQKGLALDQISAANILSRKDGQNIFDILDSIADGKNIEKLIKEIYGVTVSSKEQTDLEKVETAVKALKYNVPSTLLESRKADLSAVVEQAESNYQNAIDKKADYYISKLNIADDTSDTSYDVLNECDYPVNVKNALLNKGYTPNEILKASKLSADDIYDAAKTAREVMKNETQY